MDLYPNHRVSSNLLKCLHEWTKSHDKRNPTDGIYLDYEKAFDCVPIQCLLHKIEHLGIRGNLLATFSPELSMCVPASKCIQWRPIGIGPWTTTLYPPPDRSQKCPQGVFLALTK